MVDICSGCLILYHWKLIFPAWKEAIHNTMLIIYCLLQDVFFLWYFCWCSQYIAKIYTLLVATYIMINKKSIQVLIFPQNDFILDDLNNLQTKTSSYY